MNGFERTFRNKLSSRLLFSTFIEKKVSCVSTTINPARWIAHRGFGRDFNFRFIVIRLRARDWYDRREQNKTRFANEPPVICSTGENPLASGESFNVNMISDPTKRAMIPGAHKPHFSRKTHFSCKTEASRKDTKLTLHPSVRAAVPASIGAAKPPRLWAIFHMPCRQIVHKSKWKRWNRT